MAAARTGDRFRTARLDLARALVIHVEDDAALAQLLAAGDFVQRGAVQVAVNLGPFGERVLVDEPLERRGVGEVVVASIDLVRARSARDL